MSEEWKIILTIFGTVISGTTIFVLGQILQRFLIEPYQRLQETIGEVEDGLSFHAQFYSNPGSFSDELTLKYSLEIRKLSTSLNTALHRVNGYQFFLDSCLLPSKQDVGAAASELMGLSNGLGNARLLDANIRRAEKIRKLLRLIPRS